MIRQFVPRRRSLASMPSVAAAALIILLVAGPVDASGAPSAGTGGATSVAVKNLVATARTFMTAHEHSHSARTVQAHDALLPCTFDGQSLIVPNVTPGSTISVSCTGFPADESVVLGEASPLEVAVDDTQALNEIDANAIQTAATNGAGDLTTTFVVPNPFRAPDPAAACPPTQVQANSGLVACLLVVADDAGNGGGAALEYSGQPTPQSAGYQEVASDGGLFSFATPFYGSEGGQPLDAPIVGMAFDPDTGGYWEVASDGGIFSFNAPFDGSMGGQRLDKPIVGMAFDPDTGGYWEVASDGGIFAFGGAGFYGSEGGKPLDKPIVGIAADPDTGGYWEVASDGGIFSFNAPFDGSEGGTPLVAPVVGMAFDAVSGGYWEVASDGGIFSFGGALFAGSEGGTPLVKPIVGMASDPATGGYWMVASDGGIFSFNAPFWGSEGGTPLVKPVVGMTGAVVE